MEVPRSWMRPAEVGSAGLSHLLDFSGVKDIRKKAGMAAEEDDDFDMPVRGM